jgi:hypothetical protein
VELAFDMDADTYANLEALCTKEEVPIENAEKVLINLINSTAQTPASIRTGSRNYTRPEITYKSMAADELAFLVAENHISGSGKTAIESGKLPKGSPTKEAIAALKAYRAREKDGA